MEIICKRFDELSINELYSILRARAEVFVCEQQIVYQDLDEIDFASTPLFVLIDGVVCSYLRIIDAGVKYPELSIGRVLTLKPYRNKGYALMLMKMAIEMADKLSVPIKIEAQSYLLNFYESLGFRKISDEFVLEGISHIEMIYERH